MNFCIMPIDNMFGSVFLNHLHIVNRYKLLFFIVIFFTKNESYSQCSNLVPNYSFEYYSSCPAQTGQLEKAVPWMLPTKGSSDYFNVCHQSFVDVPKNTFGIQSPVTGDAYAGLFVLEKSDYREYLQSPLLASLIPGETYEVSMYVSLADYSYWAVDVIGILFSVDPVGSSASLININATPQIMSDSGVFISDTSAWVEVSGSFIADSAYKYITLGNFKDDAATNKKFSSAASPYGQVSYYYIDDISVTGPYRIFSDTGVSICEGENMILSANSLASSSYLWSTGDTLPAITVQPTLNAVYSIEITNGNCLLKDSINVKVYPLPTASITRDSIICFGDTISLVASGGISFLWNNAQTNDSILISPGNSTIYWVEVTDANNCLAIDSVTIKVNVVNADFSVSPGTGQLPLHVDFTNSSSGASIYEWRFEPDADSYEIHPDYTYTQSGFYTSMLIAKDSLGCVDTAYQTIFVEDIPTLFFPNSFTPNNDGVNDVFRVEAFASLSSFSLFIYNKWGEVIFRSDNQMDGWSGRYNNQDSPAGIYIWKVSYLEDLETNIKISKTGNLALVR